MSASSGTDEMRIDNENSYKLAFMQVAKIKRAQREGRITADDAGDEIDLLGQGNFFDHENGGWEWKRRTLWAREQKSLI